MGLPVSRTLLAASGALLVAAAFAAPTAGRRPAAVLAPAGPAWSAQLHLHGSFSEGLGSIDSHSFEATEVGVDVLWWSDHDHRISSYRTASAFGFDAESEPLGQGEEWDAGPLEELRESKKRGGGKWFTAPLTPPHVRGGWTLVEGEEPGQQGLEIRATNLQEEPEAYLVTLESENAAFRRPLAADVTLVLAVRPETARAGAHPLVRLALSEHAPREGDEPERLVLELAFLEEPGDPRLVGSTWRVELPVRAGEWNRLSIPVTEHAVAGFPFLPAGEDNALYALRLGVESSGGERALAVFDDLRLLHGQAGGRMLERQREVIAAVGERYPGLVQHQGLEVSYASLHLNEFSMAPQLFDYDEFVAGLSETLTQKDRRSLAAVVAEAVVAEVHARGGLASYNHMFGASWSGRAGKQGRSEVLRDLRDSGVRGADLLEVGYRARGGHGLEDHLWVWDRLALAGHPLVGTGVSDSHGGPDGRWRTAENNFVSWILAPDTSRASLLEGLRAGRVFFGDITRFDGLLDIETGRGFRMGQVVWTDRPTATVRPLAEGLPDGFSLVAVRSGKVLPKVLPGDAAELELELAQPVTTLRFELRDDRGAAGEPVALTNPVTFVQGSLEREISGSRCGLDLGGVFAQSLGGLDLSEARVEASAEGNGLLLQGTGRGGPVRLDCAGLGGAARVEVELDGLAGSWRTEGDVLVLEDLTGRGELRLRARP